MVPKVVPENVLEVVPEKFLLKSDDFLWTLFGHNFGHHFRAPFSGTFPGPWDAVVGAHHCWQSRGYGSVPLILLGEVLLEA